MGCLNGRLSPNFMSVEKYKFVTREEISNCYGEEGLDALCYKLLAEREAYREVAFNNIGKSREGTPNVWLNHFVEIDAEAARILDVGKTRKCTCNESSPDRLVIHRKDGPCYLRDKNNCEHDWQRRREGKWCCLCDEVRYGEFF